jgi:hypothetical protein
MADDEQPEYTLYRSKPKLFGRRDDDDGLREMQDAVPQGWDEGPVSVQLLDVFACAHKFFCFGN